MLFLFLPVAVGCQSEIRPKGEKVLGQCPRCRNMSVLEAKKTTWFEFCLVPLIPVHWERLWVCHICSWQEKRRKDETSYIPRAGPSADVPMEEFIPPDVPGYQPAYIQSYGSAYFPAAKI